jgi:hypothetical protein
MVILLCALFLLGVAGYLFLRRRDLKLSRAAAAAKNERWILLEIERNDNAVSGISWDVREVRKAA